MENEIQNVIDKSVQEITQKYKTEELFRSDEKKQMPSRAEIIQIIKELRCIIFPGYFDDDNRAEIMPGYYAGEGLVRIYLSLKKQIVTAFLYKNKDHLTEEQIDQRAEEICCEFFGSLSEIQSLLLKDVQAGFDGDPAAQSKEDIIFSYPGFFAIYVYRIAHILYKNKVPFVPRVMTEYAHGKTGIDINSGAEIGEYFFIDHGTGVVIGETTEIGNNVKIYQGVTLGALSTRVGQQLAGVKRHPTIEDGVTIYSNSTILGGKTVIGEKAIIGGNAFITESVPPHTRVSVKTPELTFRGMEKEEKKKEGCWDWNI